MFPLVLKKIRNGSLTATAGVTCDEGIRSRLLLSPGRDENSDVTVTSLQEPINSQLDALTGEHFLVSMTARAERHVRGRFSDAEANKNYYSL